MVSKERKCNKHALKFFCCTMLGINFFGSFRPTKMNYISSALPVLAKLAGLSMPSFPRDALVPQRCAQLPSAEFIFSLHKSV